MIKYGHIDNFGITNEQMSQLNFDDYFQCYQQTPAVEQYYTEQNIKKYGYDNVRGGKYTNSNTLHKTN